MVKYIFTGKNWTWINDLDSSKEITDKHIDIMYKMDNNLCNTAACKTNCSTNPYCLNGLGEKKLASLIQKEVTISIEREDFLRNTDQHIGLKNLGATCYINTYLQVWFNNIIFREHILQIPFEKLNLIKEENQMIPDLLEDIPTFQVDKNKCIALNTQLIFSLMKDSIRKSLDPNFFIKALGLDEHMQQDAQEFSQLFLTTLQTSLNNSNLSSGFEEQRKLYFPQASNDIISDLFKGKCTYITKCNTCQFGSERESDFFELTLNIQNSTHITHSMRELLDEEEMNGDNSYDCSVCRRKCNAKRKSKLTSLPPVLNLQLLRFVYDRNLMYKKKLTNKIKFSETLDLKPFMGDADNKTNDSANTYSLGAILMHVGKTAYSGHYMAHIKDFERNKWFQFNDESITELKKKNQLGCTEEESEKTASKEKDSKDSSASTDQKTNSTSNAYLLVYYRTDLVNQMKDTDSKTNESNQDEIIRQDNMKLNDWFAKMKSSKTFEIQSKNEERETMTSIYNSLWISKETKKDLNDHYFVNTEFMRRLISSQNNISKTDLENICSIQKHICQHNRLNPLIINKLKLISSNGYQNIIALYGSKINDLESLFLKAYDNQTTRCKECAISCFEFLKCKERIKNDVKTVKNLLKNEPLIDDISKLTNNTNELNLNNDCMVIENNNSNEIEKEDIRDDNNNSNDENATNSDASMGASNENNKENSSNSSSIQNTNYWVGKETIKVWQSLILKYYESQLPTSKSGEEEPDTNSNAQTPEMPDGKNLEKDGIEIIEAKAPETNVANEIVLKTEPANSFDIDIETENTIQTLKYFNEDIICPHNNLMPGLNKRLVSAKLWNIIYEKYPIPKNPERAFKKFTNENRECKLCLKKNEETENKNKLVKLQKDLLSDLFSNKQRPTLDTLKLNQEYYLAPYEFIKEWRTMIKQKKSKNIRILNEAFICEHECLPFNEHSFDVSLITIVTLEEWKTLTEHFKPDKTITLIKSSLLETECAKDEKEAFSYIFEPNPCEYCIEKNELDKYLFENRKIFIRLIEDETPAVATKNNSPKQMDECAKETNEKDDDILEITPVICKKPRLATDVEMETDPPAVIITTKNLGLRSNPQAKQAVALSNSNNNSNSSAATRRSKRARKCKGDLEIFASSYDTVKELKKKICGKLSRMISEQHLFHQGEELQNEKTLADYKIRQTDVINLKLDAQIGDDYENACYAGNAHEPEVGFRGTNLTG